MKKLVLFFLMLVLTINIFAFSVEAQENKSVLLKEINIVPISIISSKSNNFLYEVNGNDCIKVLNFSIENNFKKINLINSENYLIKDNNYNFKLQNYVINTNSYLQENIILNMTNNFKFGDLQYEVKVTNEPIILKINKKLSDENKNFQIEFNNINLSSGGISLKITLCFEVL